MRKILLTSVGVAALAVSANATDFTLSGTSKLRIADDGNTSVANTINVGVSKTFDNGMVLSLSQNMDSPSAKMTVTSDAVAVTFGDFDQNEKAPALNGNAAANDINTDGISHTNTDGGAGSDRDSDGVAGSASASAPGSEVIDVINNNKTALFGYTDGCLRKPVWENLLNFCMS